MVTKLTIIIFESIQTQKRYPASFDKISILTGRILVISSQIVSCELPENFLLVKYVISVAAILVMQTQKNKTDIPRKRHWS